MDLCHPDAGGSRMKKFILVLLLCSWPCLIWGQDILSVEKSFKKLPAAGLFFNQPTGSIAFLPKVGDERYLDWVATYYLLPESGFYTLPRKSNYFFRVNHKAKTQEVSYLGVLAYIIYGGNYSHRNPLHLTRNDSKWLPGEANRSLDKKNYAYVIPKVQVADFFQAHQTESIKKCDEILTFTWHAAVETGSPYSWDYRSKWHNAKPPHLDNFLTLLNVSPTDYGAAITAHLIQFSTTNNPSKMLDFYFNADNAVGVYLHVFSPLGPEFDKEFYFRIK